MSPTSGLATIRHKLGHLETLPIDLLNAHLNAFFIFNHLDTMNGSSKLLLCSRAAQKSWFITCSAWITCGDMARFVTNRCHTPTCAKLCRKNGGDLEQIKFLLGHSSIQTTERYLGSEQDIEIAVNDNLGL
jgi:hypothetical protein